MAHWYWLCVINLCFLSSSQILFSSKRVAALLVRPRHCDRSCAVPVQSVPKTLLVCRNPSESLCGCHCSVSSGHLESALLPEILHGKVQVGKDQEKAQSEKDSHSKNRGGKNQTNNQVLIP